MSAPLPTREAVLDVMRSIGVHWLYDDAESATDAVMAVIEAASQSPISGSDA